MKRLAAGTKVSLGFALIGAIALVLRFASTAAAESPFSVEWLAFHPKSNARVLVRGSSRDSDSELRLVDFSDPAKPSERRIAAKVSAAAFLPDGRHVVIGGVDGALRVAMLDGTAAGQALHPSGEKVVGVAVSSSGRFLAEVDRKLRLRVWQADGRGFRPRWQNELDPKSSPSERTDIVFAPDESAVAVISNFGSVFVRTIDGRAIAVPLGRMSYESCCGVRIGFTGDSRFMIARRGYEPGWDAFVWTFRAGRLEGGAMFPGAAHVHDFAASGGKTSMLTILDNAGLRAVTLGDDEGGPLGLPSATEERTLVEAEPAKAIELVVVWADGARIITKEFARDQDGRTAGEAVVYRDGLGALLGRIELR